jgi:hypothetical protein
MHGAKPGFLNLMIQQRFYHHSTRASTSLCHRLLKPQQESLPLPTDEITNQQQEEALLFPPLPTRQLPDLPSGPVFARNHRFLRIQFQNTDWEMEFNCFSKIEAPPLATNAKDWRAAYLLNSSGSKRVATESPSCTIRLESYYQKESGRLSETTSGTEPRWLSGRFLGSVIVFLFLGQILSVFLTRKL